MTLMLISWKAVVLIGIAAIVLAPIVYFLFVLILLVLAYWNKL